MASILFLLALRAQPPIFHGFPTLAFQVAQPMLEGVEECDLAARIASVCAETDVQAEEDVELAAACVKSGDEDDELAVLPRHTKVIVTGNNRTKSVLVGLEGVVKKAVGLGGWHWLVLTNGAEVKLQRNALSVLEAPTGLEEDDDDLEDFASNNPNLEELGKPFRLRARVQKHSVLRAGNRNSTRMLTSDTSRLLRVDFSKFEMASLLRYWRHFELVELGPNPSKEQLVSAVERHFMSLQLDETQVITSFMQAAKRLKTVCG